MISLGWCLLGSSHYHHAQFPSFALCFAAGMYGAWVFIHIDGLRRRPRLVASLLLADIAGLVACANVIGHRASPGSVLSAPLWAVGVEPLLLGTLCVLVTVAPAPVVWLLTNRAMGWIASRSYSLYLYQLIAIHFALQSVRVRADGSWRALLTMTAVAVPLTMIAAEISYRVAERPFQRWANARRSG